MRDFAEHLERHEKKLSAYVRARVRRPEDADDCLQEIRLKVTRSIDTFRDGEPFSPWLMTIAANTVRNHLTRKRPTASLAAEPADAGPGAAERLIRREDARAIGAALRSLPDRYREVILLRTRDGLRHAKVARALGVSEGAARVLFCRALAALRKAVGGDHDAP